MELPKKNITRNDWLFAEINNISFQIHHHGFAELDSRWQDSGIVTHTHILFLVTSGEGHYSVNSENFVLKKNHAYLIPRGVTVNFSCPQRLEKYYFFFSLEYFGVYDLLEIYRPEVLFRRIQPPPRGLVAPGKAHQLHNVIETRQFLLNHILAFLPKTQVIPAEKIAFLIRFRPVIDAISAHPGIKQNLSGLAEKAGLNPVYLSAVFKEHTGRNLKTFITDVLLKKIRHELTFTDKKIREIAHEMEFDDETYFSRFFKKHCKLTPFEFRQKSRLGLTVK